MRHVILAYFFMLGRGLRFQNWWNRICPLRANRHFRLCAGMLIWALVGFALAGCRSKDALTPEQAEGKHLYDVRCEHCHGENDLNLKKVPPNLHGLFGRTTLPSGAPATDAEVQKVVLEGKGMMPSFAGRFTTQQMSDLLAYLHKGIR